MKQEINTSCYVKKCKDKISAQKQFNPDFIRIMLCRKHLDTFAKFYIWEDFYKKLEEVEKSNG